MKVFEILAEYVYVGASGDFRQAFTLERQEAQHELEQSGQPYWATWTM